MGTKARYRGRVLKRILFNGLEKLRRKLLTAKVILNGLDTLGTFADVQS